MTARERAELTRLLEADSAPPAPQAFDEWLTEASPEWRWDWPHLVRMRAELARLIAGEIDRLFIGCPPRHGKSEQNTIRFAAWYLEQHPTHWVLIGSYAQTMANKFSRGVRRILRARGVRFSADRNAVEEWELAAGGGLRAAGRGSGITGRGFQLIILDDLIKDRKEAYSKATRDAAWEWLSVDVMTRLEPGGKMAVTMTPWHEDDPSARLARELPGEFAELRMPAIAEPTVERPDPLGRAVGDALWPWRYPVEALRRLQKATRHLWWALFQIRPQPAEGTIFKRPWFARRYRDRPPSSLLVKIVQSWDCAIKAGERNSLSVCTTWGISREDEVYLLDVWAEHVDFADLETAAYDLYDRWRPHAMLVEDKGNGSSLITNLARGRKATEDRPAHAPIRCIKIEPEGDKVFRADEVAPIVESKVVRLPQEAEWLPDFLDEVLTFPASVFNDRVDSFTQFLRWWHAKRAALAGAAGPTRLQPARSANIVTTGGVR